MNYEIVKTGSKGNFIVINDFIGIDCGVSFTTVKPYYKKLKVLFITHSHSWFDHFSCKTIKKLAELRPTLKFVVADYLVQNLYDIGVNKKNIYVLDTDKWYNFNAFKCQLTPTVHDVPNVAIHLSINGEKLLYATDTATLDCIQAKNYNYYLVERKLWWRWIRTKKTM